MINPALRKLLPGHEGRFRRFRARPALEPVYQTIFRRDLERWGVEDDFYPVGSAANYSLLYLVARICREIAPNSVLDIGAGQTSVLWSRLLGSEKKHILTVEHDPEWSGLVGKRIGHDILLTSLASRPVCSRQVETYDWDAIRARGPFEVILCDGPPGTPQWSRFGVMSLIDDTLPENFIIVMDDAERDGETATINAIRARLQEMGRPVRLGKIGAQKAQAIIAGGDYWPAAYF